MSDAKTGAPLDGAAAAFSEIAATYDRDWTATQVGALQRAAVWRALDRLFGPADRVLDLGCGTGADAAHLARRGVQVLATDISPPMVQATRDRAEELGLSEQISARVVGIEGLAQLDAECFDGAFSNFGALNCIGLGGLPSVAQALARSVRPGGRVALCVMGRFCIWETVACLVRLRPGKAFQRLSGREVTSLGSSFEFSFHYPTVAQLRRGLVPEFQFEEVRGVGIFVPPSHLEGLAKRFPRLLRIFAMADRVSEKWPVFRAIGDHRLLIFRRR
jgi:SAM-dependent methyltransferase